jgi:hypothetical protein
MNEREKSDRLVLPVKLPNNAARAAAEVVEGRGLREGNAASKTRPGLRAGQGASSALDRVRRTVGSRGLTLLPERGAQCGSSARWDLRGGRLATGVPTATIRLVTEAFTDGQPSLLLRVRGESEPGLVDVSRSAQQGTR